MISSADIVRKIHDFVPGTTHDYRMYLPILSRTGSLALIFQINSLIQLTSQLINPRIQKSIYFKLKYYNTFENKFHTKCGLLSIYNG